jgi:hypothetical protein
MFIEQSLAAATEAAVSVPHDPAFNYIQLVVSTAFSPQVIAIAVILLILRSPNIVGRVTNFDFFGLKVQLAEIKQQIATTSEKINEVDEKLNTLQQGYLEHGGARERHLQFLREVWRVSVIEFHMIRREFFASEDKLNLLSREALACLASTAGITNQNSTVLLYSGGRRT